MQVYCMDKMQLNAGAVNVKRAVHVGTTVLNKGVLCVLFSSVFLKIGSLYVQWNKSSAELRKSGTCLSARSHFNRCRKRLKRIQDLPAKEQKGGRCLKTAKNIFNHVFSCFFRSYSASSQREVTTY
jgi:hypothetical protein